MTTTVLVIGGTGVLGAPVAERLRDDGYYVRMLVRDLGRMPESGSDFEFVEGDLHETTSLPNALDGCAASSGSNHRPCCRSDSRSAA